MLTMSLPFETLSHIFSFLPNSSLKRLRLASKGFCDIATPLLFSSIFVSANHLDREIAELVAAELPNSIHTLTFSTTSHYNMAFSEFVSHFKCKPSRCGDPTLHAKKAEDIWELHCQIGWERQALYESGAVQGQLCRILNTLPNLRQIVITDRRRRQDLSWLQEALMCRTIQHLSPPETRVSSISGIRHTLGDLHNVCKGTTFDKKSSNTLTRIRTKFRGKRAQALAQLQTVQHVSCDCYDKVNMEPPSPEHFSGLRDAGMQWMPETPWAMVMAALYKSPDASTLTVSVEPKDPESQLLLAALKDCDPDILLATSTALARLTVLELSLTIDTINLTSWMRPGEVPTKMLSAACNLQSLTINTLREDGVPRPWSCDLRHLTSSATVFELLLAGCELPHLATLHLHNVTFRENDFAVFLQHSPKISDLNLRSFFMVDVWRDERLIYAGPQAWERVFHTIKETLPCLRHFEFSDWQRPDPAHADSYAWKARVAKDFDNMVQSFFFHGGINPFADIAALSLTENYRTLRSVCEWCRLGLHYTSVT